MKKGFLFFCNEYCKMLSLTVLLACMINRVSAQNNTPNIVMQFRAPLSLREILHEGLLTVQQDIESLNNCTDQEIEIILMGSMQKLQHLQNMYSEMNSKTGLNGIYSDERNFLQHLIDRIDQLIQTLENSSSESEQNANNNLINKNIELLHTLRASFES